MHGESITWIVVCSNDSELLTLLRRGETRAFEYIYSTYFDALVNYADRLLNDMEAARDVVQQVYYKMWEHREELRISLSARAYLYKAVYHESLNTLTHQNNIRKYEQEQLSDFYLSTVLQVPEAEMELWQSDIEKAIREAINNLPEKCREVFMLSKINGLKNKEVAEKLNISEKTVERHMSIALSKLRVELDWILEILLFFSISRWG